MIFVYMFLFSLAISSAIALLVFLVWCFESVDKAKDKLGLFYYPTNMLAMILSIFLALIGIHIFIEKIVGG